MSKPTIFQSPRYTLQYEQLNINLNSDQPHGSYGLYAQDTLQLAGTPQGSKILEVGSGTGVATTVLFENVSEITVVGTDKADNFLQLARAKFHHRDIQSYLLELEQGGSYPPFLRQHCNLSNLGDYLRRVYEQNAKFADKVSFQTLEAANLGAVSERNFDLVFMSQVFHWFRREGPAEEQPNKDYEQRVLQACRELLKPAGQIVFNTTAADYQFPEELLHKHFFNHPFYRAFYSAINSELGLSPATTITRYLSHQELEDALEKSGFEITRQKITEYRRQPERLIEPCMIGGQMQIFQKLGLDVSVQEREAILEKALQSAMTKCSPEQHPFVEIGVHYVAKKK